MEAVDGHVWASGDRKTVDTHYWYTVHPDGTLEVYQVEEIESLRKRDKWARVKTMGIPIMRIHPLGTTNVYYIFTQLFYTPGDTMHSNGQFLETVNFDKAANKLRELGFKYSETFPREHLPASIL